MIYHTDCPGQKGQWAIRQGECDIQLQISTIHRLWGGRGGGSLSALCVGAARGRFPDGNIAGAWCVFQPQQVSQLIVVNLHKLNLVEAQRSGRSVCRKLLSGLSHRRTRGTTAALKQQASHDTATDPLKAPGEQQRLPPCQGNGQLTVMVMLYLACRAGSCEKMWLTARGITPRCPCCLALMCAVLLAVPIVKVLPAMSSQAQPSALLSLAKGLLC